jgi:hypothetical protein
MRFMIHRKAASLLLALAFLLLPSTTTVAQGGTTGCIAGTVKDPNGAVIAGAEVSGINSEAGKDGISREKR